MARRRRSAARQVGYDEGCEAEEAGGALQLIAKKKALPPPRPEGRGGDGEISREEPGEEDDDCDAPEDDRPGVVAIGRGSPLPADADPRVIAAKNHSKLAT